MPETYVFRPGGYTQILGLNPQASAPPIYAIKYFSMPCPETCPGTHPKNIFENTSWMLF